MDHRKAEHACILARSKEHRWIVGFCKPPIMNLQLVQRELTKNSRMALLTNKNWPLNPQNIVHNYVCTWPRKMASSDITLQWW